MGHSIGTVRDHYIFPSDGADQLCGRMVCGLPFNDEKFAVLPPHFVPPVLGLLTDEFWRTIVPGYENYPDAFKSIFPFLLASLIYHEDYLRGKLPTDHPIWTARVFTQNSLLPTLRQNRPVLIIGACPSTGMKATGIPPHLAIAKRLADLVGAVDELRSRIDGVEHVLRQSLPKEVAEQVCGELRASFVIDGVAPVSMRDIDSRFAAFEASVRAMFEASIARNAAMHATGQAAASENDAAEWRKFDWNDGCITHYVPPGWRFPHGITVKAMWDLWFFGDRSTGIRPYRALSKSADVARQDQMMYRRAEVTMQYIQKKVEAEGGRMPAGKRYVSQLTIVESDRIFDAVIMTLLAELYPPHELVRKEEIKYSTLYNLIVKSDVNGEVVRKRKRNAVNC
jgi:hypothetical protein